VPAGRMPALSPEMHNQNERATVVTFWQQYCQALDS